MSSADTGPGRAEPAFPPPAVLSRWWVWAVLAAVFLIPFFLPISQDLRRHPVIGSLGEQLHIPLLACLTLLIYWKGPLRGHLWRAAAAAAVLGAVIEGVQELVGRSALFQDWLLDLIGIGLVVGFVLWRGHGRQAGKWLLIVLLLIIPAQLWYLPFAVTARYEARLTFPVIADFQGDHYRWLWDDIGGSRIGFATADTLHDRVLQLEGGPPSRWPGARMTHFPCDWTGFRELVFAARATRISPDSEGRRDRLRFGVRIDDYQGRQDGVWANQTFQATERWQTFTMQVADRQVLQKGRVLDLTDVESILFFTGSPTDSFTLEIDDIRLQ